MKSNLKVILIHGNGGGSSKSHWFPYMENELKKLGLIVVVRDFPDPIFAREKYWIPFLEKLKTNENSILIGHSSGAVAAMRFAETHTILGSILVGACYTDLNDEEERKSGYYNRPWKWQNIKKNQEWIVQFASSDDPYIPIQEARYIHEKLNTEYYEYNNQGHFTTDSGRDKFPEIIKVIKAKLNL